MVNVLLNYYNFGEPWAYSTLSKYINAQSRVTVVPLAFRDSQAWDLQSWMSLYCTHGEKYANIVRPFEQYGINAQSIKWLNYFADDTNSAKQKIAQSDIVLLCGGLPEKILERLAKLNITNDIINYKGVLIGVSAGAMVQLDNYHITPDDDYPNYIATNKGLAMLNNFDVEVHYTQSDIQQQCIKRALADNGKDIIAMWHEGGIVVDNNNNVFTTFGKTQKFCCQR